MHDVQVPGRRFSKPGGRRPTAGERCVVCDAILSRFSKNAPYCAPHVPILTCNCGAPVLSCHALRYDLCVVCQRKIPPA